MEKPFRTIIGTALAALIFLTLGILLRDSLLTVFSKPLIWANGVRVSFTTSLRSIGQLDQLRSDRESLQGEVASLRQQLSDTEELNRENTALRQELGVTSSNRDLPKVIAQVISQTSSVIDRSFLINAGRSEGIALGDAVIANGYLIGRILEIQNHTSRVRSIVSKQSIVQVWTISGSVKGLLRGDGNTVIFDNVEQGQQVEEHAVLETSGLGGSVPRGLLIGSITEKTSNTTDLTQSFRVSLGMNPNDSTTVFVITSQGE